MHKIVSDFVKKEYTIAQNRGKNNLNPEQLSS